MSSIQTRYLFPIHSATFCITHSTFSLPEISSSTALRLFLIRTATAPPSTNRVSLASPVRLSEFSAQQHILDPHLYRMRETHSDSSRFDWAQEDIVVPTASPAEVFGDGPPNELSLRDRTLRDLEEVESYYRATLVSNFQGYTLALTSTQTPQETIRAGSRKSWKGPRIFRPKTHLGPFARARRAGAFGFSPALSTSGSDVGTSPPSVQAGALSTIPLNVAYAYPSPPRSISGTSESTGAVHHVIRASTPDVLVNSILSPVSMDNQAVALPQEGDSDDDDDDIYPGSESDPEESDDEEYSESATRNTTSANPKRSSGRSSKRPAAKAQAGDKDKPQARQGHTPLLQHPATLQRHADAFIQWYEGVLAGDKERCIICNFDPVQSPAVRHVLSTHRYSSALLCQGLVNSNGRSPSVPDGFTASDVDILFVMMASVDIKERLESSKESDAALSEELNHFLAEYCMWDPRFHMSGYDHGISPTDPLVTGPVPAFQRTRFPLVWAAALEMGVKWTTELRCICTVGKDKRHPSFARRDPLRRHIERGRRNDGEAAHAWLTCGDVRMPYSELRRGVDDSEVAGPVAGQKRKAQSSSRPAKKPNTQD